MASKDGQGDKNSPFAVTQAAQRALRAAARDQRRDQANDPPVDTDEAAAAREALFARGGGAFARRGLARTPVGQGAPAAVARTPPVAIDAERLLPTGIVSTDRERQSPADLLLEGLGSPAAVVPPQNRRIAPTPARPSRQVRGADQVGQQQQQQRGAAPAPPAAAAPPPFQLPEEETDEEEGRVSIQDNEEFIDAREDDDNEGFGDGFANGEDDQDTDDEAFGTDYEDIPDDLGDPPQGVAAAAAPVAPDHDDIAMADRPVKVRSFETGSPGDWVVYRKYFEGMRAMWGWDDARSRRELITAMDGEAARMTQDINFLAAGQTFEDLIGNFEGRFITQAGAKMAQTEFRRARQMPDESLIQFHSRVRTLFTRAYPGVATEGDGLARLLRDTFTWGLESRKVIEYVSDSQPATYQDCLQRAQEKLATLVGFEEERSKRNARGSLNAVKVNEDGPKDDRTCHGCGQQGHFYRQCPIMTALRKAQESGLVGAVKDRRQNRPPSGQGRGGRGARRSHPMNRKEASSLKKRINNIDLRDDEPVEEESENEEGAGL